MEGAKSPSPAPGRRDRNRQRMASRLTATAFELFEAQGYEAVTMEQIATQSDVAKATLYNYFPVKEALIAHRFREEIAEGMLAIATDLAARKTFASRMQFLLRASAAWHTTKRAYLPYYLRFLNNVASYGDQKPQPDTYDSGSRHILAEMFRAARKSGEIKSALSPEQLAWSFEYLLLSAVTAWLYQPGTDLAQGFLSAFELLLNGIGTSKSRRLGDQGRASGGKVDRGRPK
jgi:AcrR family transcriptional regulator